MTRVIHTGDTHIGYQQYHSPERREDFMRAFEGVIDDAVEADVDAVVHAGDLFHDRRPELRDLLGTISALRRLEEADIPFLAIVGNHESTRGGQWLDLFERLGLATRLDADPVVVGDVAFYGLDHVPRSQRAELEYDFADHDATYAALVAHGLFQPFPHGDWDAETVLTEATVDFDAMLLGDNHAHDVATVAGTWVTYCGSTERASASERDARGYNLVTFDPDAESAEDEDGPAATDDSPASVDIRRRSLDDVTREFVFVSVDLASGEGVDRVREQLRQHDLDEAVTIVELTGEGEPVTPAEIEAFALEEGALIARVTDRREESTVETELSVSFADPDDAVRERVDEMGLSTAARDLEETVRASKVADSNVRERVQEHVRERLEDPAAFETADSAADSGEPAADPDSDLADSAADPDADSGDSAADPDADSGEPAADPDANSDEPAAGVDADPGGSTADSTTVGSAADADAEFDESTEEPTDESVADGSGSPASTASESADETEPNDQASMEDYL